MKRIRRYMRTGFGSVRLRFVRRHLRAGALVGMTSNGCVAVHIKSMWVSKSGED